MLTGTSRPHSVYQSDQSVVIVFVPSRVWRWGNVSLSVVHHVLVLVDFEELNRYVLAPVPIRFRI